MEFSFIFLIILSYLIGSIPFAYIATIIFGYGDIRKVGSGNVGATNVLRTGKKSLDLLVLILVILKGFVPLSILFIFYHSEYSNMLMFFIGSFAVMGHIFPIWLRFKGGKGVATYIGYILAIDYKLGIIFIILWLIIVFLKKYSSLASITSLIILPICAMVLSYDLQTICILIFLSTLITIKHSSNIKRLISRSENKIKF